MLVELGTALLALGLATITESAPSTYLYLNIESVRNPLLPRLLVGKWDKGTLRCNFTRDPVDFSDFINTLDEGVKLVNLTAWEYHYMSKRCGLYGPPVTGDGLTWPGTKWCGPGNMASSYDDLGTERELDICCRAHDHCDTMKSGETKNNLTNISQYSRLHCDCDAQFFNCLKRVKRLSADNLGYVYYNLYQNKCYDYTHPIAKCVKRPSIGNCDEYELDGNQPKLWQFFDARMY